MKKLSLIPVLCLLVMSLMVAPAQAEKTGVYAGLKFIDSIQTVWIEDRTNSSNTLGGAVFAGYDFYAKNSFPVRVEIEYALRSNYVQEISNVDVTFNAQTLLANFYFDFHNDSAFTPYVGAGLGMAFNRYHADGNNDDFEQYSTNFAWQIGAGVAYAFNETVSADLGYRYMSFGTTNLDDGAYDTDAFSSAHEISLGLRFNF